MKSFIAVLCLVLSTNGAPQQNRRPIALAKVTNQGTSIETSFGTFPISPNGMTLEQKDQYLPVLKALLNVMEQKKPASEDINTLLMLTRDLLKNIPEGQSLPSLGFGAGFGGFGLEGVKDMGLPDTGDVIIDIKNQPHIITRWGAFPLSDVSLMTDEERERFLPVTRTFVKVLENDNATPEDINLLVEQSSELANLIPGLDGQTDVGNVATQEPSSTFSGAQNVRNQGSEPQVVDSVNTIFGSIPLKSSNPLTPELRSTLLPVMKALLKVMETDRPAPEDINSLLLLTRDLTKKIPEGSIPSFGAGSSFGGFDTLDEILPETGDVIEYIDNKPFIITQWGTFPLSETNLLTAEEREQFLPATRTFASVLGKENVDPEEISLLLEQSRELSTLIPDNLIGRLGGGLGLGGLLSQ